MSAITSEHKLSYTYKELSKMEPEQLYDYLANDFLEDVPSRIETVEDMIAVQRLFPVITNRYSFVAQALAFVKLETRRLKAVKDMEKTPESKSEYEDMISKRDVIQTVADILDFQYKSMSRAITVRQEINREINMCEGLKYDKTLLEPIKLPTNMAV